MTSRLTVAAVLDEAERQLDEFDPHTSGTWPHAAAVLIRQSLESTLNGFWVNKSPEMLQTNWRDRWQCLPAYLGDKPEARGDQGKHDQTRTRQPRAEAGQRRGHGKEWRRAADRNDNGACGAGADQGAVMHVNCLAPASGGPDSRHSCWRPRWHRGSSSHRRR